ncbi:hypothetical protein F7725_011127 [Dissostichus mawsoni]|uniref:Uncharacterized protein n=1 Tax=Dissostichus mawsoni TaxID=36200 RepID=A0A7J5Z8D5_DISMA|nr:hypothetical protein F7725_011127 [Dissostichus mawsoni]
MLAAAHRAHFREVCEEISLTADKETDLSFYLQLKPGSRRHERVLHSGRDSHPLWHHPHRPILQNEVDS